MIISLRVYSTKLKIVFCKKSFAFKVISGYFLIRRPSRRIVGFRRGRFEKRIEVEYEGLQILRTFIEFPYLLVAASLIMKHADDDMFIDSFAPTRSILKNLLSLNKIHQRFFGPLDVYAFLGVSTQLDHSLQKLL